MRWQIIVAGKPALAYAKAGVDEYLLRLRRYLDAEIVTVKAGNSQEVSQRLLEKSQGAYRIVLDERGDRPTTRQLSDRFAALEMRGDVKTVGNGVLISDITASLAELVLKPVVWKASNMKLAA